MVIKERAKLGNRKGKAETFKKSKLKGDMSRGAQSKRSGKGHSPKAL